MKRRALALSAAAAVLIPFLWCFGEALFTSRSFAHRDGPRFYRPLFEWTQNEWDAGRIPLWNPQENGGSPVLGDTTSSVFYPGKAIFFLPLPFESRFELYIALHILAAAGFTFLAARQWKASVPAGALAALSYTFGGYVLFQHTNVVFLVGAAWLPAAAIAIDRMLRRRSMISAIVFGIILALMTLGGDPQTAYNAGLFAVLYAWILRRRYRRRLRKLPSKSLASMTGTPLTFARRLKRNRFVLLGVAASCSAVLAAVQILPSLDWSSRSSRAVYDAPRSIYAIPAILSEEEEVKLFRNDKSDKTSRIQRGLLGSPQKGTYHRSLYRYSIEPARLAELAFPNVGGKTFPENRRVMLADIEDVDPWTPSLYMGILPLALALGAWAIRRGSIRDRWLSWSVLLAMLGSFGWWGPGWLLQEANLVSQNAAGEPSIGEPVGGLYWMMVVMLPGYDQFRYPAKLFVVASLSLSLLAARGWDRMCRNPQNARTVLRWMGIGAVVVFTVILCTSGWLRGRLAAAPNDPLFGPLSVDAAIWVLYGSFAHTIVICGVIWWLADRINGQRRRTIQAAILILTALEVSFAQRWMVAMTSSDLWADAPWAKAVIAEHDPKTSDPFRVHRTKSVHLTPDIWRTSTSADRETELLQFNRDTLFPRTYLTTRLEIAEAETSLIVEDRRVTFAVSRLHSPRLPGDFAQLHPVLVDALGIRYLVNPNQSELSSRQRRYQRQLIKTHPSKQATLWFNPDHFPRAWIVHRVERLPKVDSQDPAVVESITVHTFFPRGRTRDLRSEAVVETDDTAVLSTPEFAAGPVPPADSCRVARYEPQEIEIHAELTRPGLVVLSDYFDPDWQAELTDLSTGTTTAIDILRTNRIMRGVYLPAGRFTIKYRYQPQAFRTGATVSSFGWGFLGLGILWTGIFRSFRRRRG